MDTVPISASDKARLGRDFDAYMKKQGKKPPSKPDEALKYEIAKEIFITEEARKQMRKNPTLKDLLSKGSLMPPVSQPPKPVLGPGINPFEAAASRAPASAYPEPARAKPQTALDVFKASGAQPTAPVQKPPMFATQGASAAFPAAAAPAPQIAEPPRSLEDMVRAGGTPGWLQNRFQSTPIPQDPRQPPTTELPVIGAQPPKLPPPPQSGSASASASMRMGGGNVSPVMDANYLKTMAEMLKSIDEPTRMAAQMQLEAMQRSQDEYNKTVGKEESQLDFYRKAMENLKRPDRKDSTLSDEDKNSMLMRFGLNMLKNNRSSFGEAFGTAGTEAINFGDRAQERRHNDAMEVYRDAMSRLNTELDLSNKDKAALRERAATSLAQAEKIAAAQGAVVTSGIPGAQARMGVLNTAFKEAMDTARNREDNNAVRAAASMRASTGSSVPDDGLTAEGYARLSETAKRRAEYLMTQVPSKDDPNYNAHMQEIQKAKDDSAAYWKASKRATGGM
jgi:hypothetical protein